MKITIERDLLVNVASIFDKIERPEYVDPVALRVVSDKIAYFLAESMPGKSPTTDISVKVNVDAQEAIVTLNTLNNLIIDTRDHINLLKRSGRDV